MSNVNRGPITPRNDGRFYTKQETDALIAALHLEFFFKNTASSDISGYLQLSPTEITTAQSDITTGTYAAGLNQLVTELRFATESGQPALAELLAGIYEIHLHISKSNVPAKSVQLYCKLYERKADNSEILVATSELSEVLLTTPTETGVHLALAANYPMAATTSRLVLKFYANIVGGGASVAIIFATADATSTGISIPVSIAALDARYTAKPHGLASAADHTSSATSGKMLKANTSGLPVDASNTDTEVADAVTKRHVAATVVDTASLDLSITGQEISGVVLPAGVSHAALATLTTGNPHTQYLLATGLVVPFYKAAGTLDTIPLTADQKVPFFMAAGTASNIPLTT